MATDVKAHGREHSLKVTLPPLGMVMFKRRA
jgi:predicted class III extradiol MEMO1 family dioxygenase